MVKSVKPGDVVFLYAHHGTSTKLRPAIIVETNKDRVYVLLGSTKNLISEPQTATVTDPAELKRMGLKYHTGFKWGKGGDQWLSKNNIVEVKGTIPETVIDKVGQAWANARFSRLL